MEKENLDIFESRNITENKKQTSVNNFFVTEGSVNYFPLRNLREEKGRRINDYDFNLLEEDAYKDLSNDIFKLEYQINRLELEIKNTESKIEASQEISDSFSIEELKQYKSNLKTKLEELLKVYNKKTISGKISLNFSNIIIKNFKKTINIIQSALNKLTFFKSLKLPKSLINSLEIKKSIDTLENINKNVDELINMKIPYGENNNKYEQLSKYIIKANLIQSELAKSIK